ncbi:alpha/beta fold hydrolase [Candidatus Stoquefichus sp. SB1]|uniref:alpha/beta fold hydrolase n=1 Tax=Candidatus Stoquefichus sp. SB1 TaxID=1658109 RepID=UPI00067EED8A
MKKAILYIHGKGGNAKEANRYQSVCIGYDIYGLDYKGEFPWDTQDEIENEYKKLAMEYDEMTIVANSIGAYFCMNALQGQKIKKALFISPIVDMEKLITDMMGWANVTEKELCQKGEIETQFGETLSWKYLEYVRNHPINWKVPTAILYADQDHLTSRKTIESYIQNHNASLTIMENGEHWFHTDEQLAFLDRWITMNI